MEQLLVGALIVSIANVIAQVILIAIFVKMYIRTRAQLPLGMSIVVIIMTLHNAVIVLFFSNIVGLLKFSGIFPESSLILVLPWLPYIIGIGIAELAGIALFLKLTLD